MAGGPSRAATSNGSGVVGELAPASASVEPLASAPTTRAAAGTVAMAPAPRDHSPSVAAPPVSHEVVRAPTLDKSGNSLTEADKKLIADRVDALWVKWQLKSKPDDVLEGDKIKIVILAESVVSKTKLNQDRTFTFT